MSDPSIVDLSSDDIVPGDFLRSIALGIDWGDVCINFLVCPLLEASVSLFLAKSLLSLVWSWDPSLFPFCSFPLTSIDAEAMTWLCLEVFRLLVVLSELPSILGIIGATLVILGGRTPLLLLAARAVEAIVLFLWGRPLIPKNKLKSRIGLIC